MRELAGILAQNRTERGAVNLESTESKILMDEEGRAREILPRQSGEAEGMIEEFMLMANQAAASLAMEKGIPFIYRVHESPSPEKLENLSSLLKLLGLDATGLTGKVSSARLAEILKGVEGTHLAPLINSQILRSMAKAPVQRDQHRPLWAGAGQLRPLYLPHPPLSRPGDPPDPGRRCWTASPRSSWKSGISSLSPRRPSSPPTQNRRP